MAIEPYEASSVHVAGFVAAAKAVGALEKALPHVAPETRAVVERPFDRKWVPAAVIQDLTATVAAKAGPEVLAELNYRMTRDSLGRLVLPLLKVGMALTGRSPASVFSRLDDSVKVAMKGVHVTWEATSPSGGVVRISYPEPPPPVVHHAWAGVFRFGYELAGTTGKLESFEYVEGGKTLVMKVSWS